MPRLSEPVCQPLLLRLPVKAALETWRQRSKFLSWGNIFPKISVLVQGFTYWSFMEIRDLPKEDPPCTVPAILFNHHRWSSHYRPVCKGNSIFLKGNGWFHFLIYESTFDCKLFAHGTEHRGPNPHQSPWVCAFTTGTNENSDCVRYTLIKPRCCRRMLLLPSLCSVLSSKTKTIAHNNLSFRLLKARHL